MPASADLYAQAIYVRDNLFSRLRTLGYRTTTNINDKNAPNEAERRYFTALGQQPQLALRDVNYGEMIYCYDWGNLYSNGRSILDYIESNLGTPYTTDFDWIPLKSMFTVLRIPLTGDYGTSSDWNLIMDFVRRLTNLILRYAPGFQVVLSESWDSPEANWDFTTPRGGDWDLDNSVYVSPPSSLVFNIPYTQAILKQASAGGPISEGMIETRFRFPKGIGSSIIFPIAFWFRYNEVGAYIMHLRGTNLGIGEHLNVVQLATNYEWPGRVIGDRDLNPTLEPDTWHRLRVSWVVQDGILHVRFQKYDGSDWIDLCDEWVDPVNEQADAAISRVGVGSVYAYPPPYSWFDDTIIYK
jgi:hypothetical protein